MIYLVIYAIFILYLDLSFKTLKNKILKLKIKNMSISKIDIISISSAIIFFNIWDYELLYCYIIYMLYDLIFSVYLRLISAKIYYKYFFKKDSVKGYISLIKFDSKLYDIIPRNKLCYIVLSISLINFNFNFWLLYWIIYELVDLFGSTFNSEYDQALFFKNQSHSIYILPKGFIKLKIYKKTILDKYINLSSELAEVLPNYSDNDCYFEHINNDFKYLDKKVEYLASIDCLYF